MPELPEVETIKNDLAEVLIGAKITDVDVCLAKMVKSPLPLFRRGVRGQSIGSLARRGKLLIVELEPSSQYVLIHLKMTGQLIYQRGTQIIAGGHSQVGMPVDNLPNTYSHIIWSFANGSRLFFNDVRQFGYMKLVSAQEKENELSVYGVEPLADAFTAALLANRLGTRRVALKQVLLDQSVIAGLGNIYVDEACFRARILPTRRADRVTAAEIKRLHAAIITVITQAIAARGTTFNNYRDAHGRTGDFRRRLKVYGRAGKKCGRCKTTALKKIKLAGRGTVFCPTCQV